MKLPRSMKHRIKEEQEKCFIKMSEAGVTLEEWKDANDKYGAYSMMLKPSWKVTPDTLLTVFANLAGILLVLNYEKIDIIRSKAFGMIMRGKF